MKRIAMLDGYWHLTPSKADFEAQNVSVLMSRMLMMYVLKQNGEIEMLHHFQIDEAAKLNRIEINLADTLCKVIEEIPAASWDKIVQQLNFGQKI